MYYTRTKQKSVTFYHFHSDNPHFGDDKLPDWYDPYNYVNTICNTKVIAMRRLAIPVTAMRALMAKAKEAEAMDTSMRVSRKIKNFDTSN